MKWRDEARGGGILLSNTYDVRVFLLGDGMGLTKRGNETAEDR